jgi:hypothetical protein
MFVTKSLSEIGEVALEIGIAPRHDVEIGILEQLRQRPAGAVADRAVVDFPDRRHFGSGAGEKDFVGHVEIVARDQPLFDPYVATSRQFANRRAGDPIEDRMQRGRLQDTVANDEDILATRFGDQPLALTW